MPRKPAQAPAATETPKPRRNVPHHELKASENDTPIADYAQKLLSAQATDLAGTFKLARVERGLINQGYPRNEIRDVIESMAEALDLA